MASGGSSEDKSNSKIVDIAAISFSRNSSGGDIENNPS